MLLKKKKKIQQPIILPTREAEARGLCEPRNLRLAWAGLGEKDRGRKKDSNTQTHL
jgi:hypothetical protein